MKQSQRVSGPTVVAVLLMASMIALGASAPAALERSERALPATTVDVITKDFEFIAPSTVPAGVVTFNLKNEGEQFHHVVLVQLGAGKTLTDLKAAMSQPGPLPGWVIMLGGPNAPAPKGGTATATVQLRPGQYLLVCLVSSRHDPEMHLLKGMVKELTVTDAAAQKAAQPQADITIMLNDYDFKLSKPLTAGTHTLRVRNFAAQPHELGIVKLAPGKTQEDLLKWFETESGPPPGLPLGGISPLSQNRVNDLTMEFTPGEYVFICFLPDPKEGKPHFVHGMIKTYRVD